MQKQDSRKKSIEKQNTTGNKRQAKGKHSLFLFFFVDQGHVETKITKKSIEKQNTSGNKRHANMKHPLFLPVSYQLNLVKKSVKARKSVIIESSERFQK